MADLLKITNKEMAMVASLVKDGFLTKDYSFGQTYITLKTVNRETRNEIIRKYERFGRSYNFLLITEILSHAIYKVGGVIVKDNEKMLDAISMLNSNIVLDMYSKHNELESLTENLIKYVDIWSETYESKSYWQLFKRIKLQEDFIKKTNEFQFFWITLNEQNDKMEIEKREWSKIEYMTNSICAFTNPKAYKSSKSKMNVSELISREYDERIERRRYYLEKLEIEGEVEYNEESERVQVNEEGLVNADGELFDSLKKRHGESQQDFNGRISSALKEHISGKVVDEHDNIVKEYEMATLKRLLQDERISREVAKELSKRKNPYIEVDINKMGDDGVFHEAEGFVGDDETLEKMDTEIQKGPWFYNGNDYSSLVMEKAFMGLTRDEKTSIFNEVMNAKYDMEKAIEFVLNKNKKKEEIKPVSSQKPIIENEIEEEETRVTDIKNMAAKAAKMNIDVKKEPIRKMMPNLEGKLDARNTALGQENDEDLMVL